MATIRTTARRIAFPLRLGWARMLSRRDRVALAAVGTAAGAAVLAGVLAASLAVRDQSLARSVARIPSADRTVRVVWGGTPTDQASSFPALDRVARRNLRALNERTPDTALLYRESRIARSLYDLAALDDIRRWVRLRSGRFPAVCRPQRCEVLRLGGEGSPPALPGLHLVHVGDGKLTSDVPFGRLSQESSSSVYGFPLKTHTAPVPLFFLARGVRELGAAAPLALQYRTYAWVVPVAPATVHPWTIEDLRDGITRVRSSFGAASDLFDVTAPDEELAGAEATSRVAGRRLLLLGGEAATLLLAFTVLAAGSFRRDVDESRRRLTWLGARRWQLAVLSASEAAAIAISGTVVGWAAGVGLGALAARHLDNPSGATLRHSVVASSGIWIALALAAAAAAILFLALWTRPLRLGGLTVSAVDAAALGAVAAIVLAVVRGAADVGALNEQRGTAVFLLLLPSLVAFVAAVVSARAVLPLARLVERVARRAPIAVRLATLSIGRHAGRAAIPVTFLVVSLGLALFAAVYRSTLVRGESDQAAYAVPRDFVLTENLSKLVPVLDAAPLAGYRRHGDVAPVIRLAGDVPRLVDSAGFTLLGVDAHAIPTLHGWRDDFARRSLGDLARRLAPPRPVGLRGTRLPLDARELVWPAAVRGNNIRLRASIETRRGEFVTVALGSTAGPPLQRLHARLPVEARGGKLVALLLELGPTGLHDISIAGLEIKATGTLRLAAPRVVTAAGEQPLSVDFADWVGVNGVRPAPSGGGAEVRFLVSPEAESLFRPRQPTDGRPVPAVVSPRLAQAANHGLLAVDIGGQSLLTRVVATAKRFPTVYGDLVVADRDTLATAMNSAAPGSAATSEIWLDARNGDVDAARRALSAPPFSALERNSRDALEHALRSNPLARGSLLALGAGAIGALALALAGLLLGLVTDVRDERGELFDLEAQGAGPRTLRRHLRLRSLLVAAFGIVGGVAAGTALSALVVALVRVTANATVPEPPLLLQADWPVLAAAAAAYAVAAAAFVGLATRRTFRGQAARRLAEVGE